MEFGGVIQESVFAADRFLGGGAGLEDGVVSTSGLGIRGIVKGDRLNLRPKRPSVKSKKYRHDLHI